MPCYKPDGTLNTNPAVQPCHQVAGSSSTCCATNHTSTTDGLPDDVCTANGLCENTFTYASGNTLTSYWRGGCSDETWESASCLKGVCFDGWNSDGHMSIQNCTDGTWCCGADENASCCANAPLKFRLAATVGVAASAWSSAVPSSTSATHSSSSTPISSSSPSSELGAGAKVGIAVGVAVVVLVLIGIIIVVVLRSSKQKKRWKPAYTQLQTSTQWDKPAGVTVYQHEERPNTTHELGVEGLRLELSTSPPSHELT